MGNSDLRSLGSIIEIEEEDIAGGVVLVDAYNWLYKYMLPVVEYTDDREYTTEDGTELPVLIGATQGMKRFFEHNITPIFIMDGGAHSEKQEELDKRRKAKENAQKESQKAKEEGEDFYASKLNARSKNITEEMIAATEELFKEFDVEYITAPQAGEAQAAYMAQQEPGVHYVVSDDYDSLLFKAPVTLRNFTSSDRPLEALDFEDTLEENGITYTQLVDVAILCGTDYNEGVHGYGPKTSVKEIQKHEDIYTLCEEENVEIKNLDVIRSIFLSPEVTDEYKINTSHTPEPNFESIRELLFDTYDISKDSVGSTLESIEDITRQPSLDEWT